MEGSVNDLSKYRSYIAQAVKQYINTRVES